jgi:myo-inositol-1(or 4)-monophosphatase
MQDIGPQELEQIYHFAIQLGKDAGKILLDGIEERKLGGTSTTEDVEKVNAVDIVTQTDNGTQTSFAWYQDN